MFCEKCGTRVEDGQPFCPNCGNRLAAPAAPVPPVNTGAPGNPGVPEGAAAPVNPGIPTGSFAPANPGVPTGSFAQTNPGVNPAPTGFAAAPRAPRQPLKLPALGGLTDKFNSLSGLKQIYYGLTLCLLAICFVFSLLKVFYVKGGTPFGLPTGASWLMVLSNVLFTLCVTFYLLDACGAFRFKWLKFFIAGSAALILFLYVIVWIAGVNVLGFTTSVRLTVGGWFFLILQAALCAVSVLYIIEDRKG